MLSNFAGMQPLLPIFTYQQKNSTFLNVEQFRIHRGHTPQICKTQQTQQRYLGFSPQGMYVCVLRTKKLPKKLNILNRPQHFQMLSFLRVFTCKTPNSTTQQRYLGFFLQGMYVCVCVCVCVEGRKVTKKTQHSQQTSTFPNVEFFCVFLRVKHRIQQLNRGIWDFFSRVCMCVAFRAP